MFQRTDLKDLTERTERMGAPGTANPIFDMAHAQDSTNDA